MNSLHLVEIRPYFNVQDGKLDDFKAIWDEAIPRINEEGGVCYYCFTYNGNMATCREAYDNADGLLAHINNTKEYMDRAKHISDIVRLEVMGPVAELDKLKEPLKDLPVEWFVNHTVGFSKMAKPSV
mmetsp:Transcript_15913/g.23970  ORF Transcript_15913/g.23970 Transcript_15913/m.23970 type:complete len:127 (-) Transcript_15913:218-598(-)